MAFKIKALSSRTSPLSRFVSRKSVIGTLIAGGAMLFTLASLGHAQSSDPMSCYHIEMTAGGTTAYFEAVSGLGSESEVVEHKIIVRGVPEPVIRKIPGRLKWSDIVLKRGITKNRDISVWRNMVENGQVDKARLDVTLIAYDNTMTPIAQWNVSKAWPKSISYDIDNPAVGGGIPPVSSLTAGDAPAVPTSVETLVLSHEGMRRIN